jgi:HlyD family secretion protein
MKRWWILIVLAILIAGAFFIWRGRSKTNGAQPYRVAVVDNGSVKTVVTATGTASAVTTVQVGSQVSGTLREIMVDFNSPVKKGQVIARIDPTFLQATVSESEANLQRAQATFTQAQRDLERTKDLFDKNLAAKTDYDNALTAVDVGKAGLAQMQAQLSRAKVNLAYSVIAAPIDGVVISRNVDVGQTVAASLQAPTLFSIAQDLQKMQIATNIDEADIGGLREGMAATFTVDSYPDEVFSATIRQIRYAATTDQGVVTYPVILDVDNSSLKLRPGMTANVTIVTAQRDDVLRLPATALRFKPANVAVASVTKSNGAANAAPTGQGRNGGQGGTGQHQRRDLGARKDSTATVPKRNMITVYVKGRTGEPEPRKVIVGLNDGSYAEILGGDLQPGDSVIVGMVGTSAVRASSNMPGVGGGRH